METLMATLIPNTLQYPNFYVDQLMHLLTPEENVVLLFAARQILGWDDTREYRRAKISLSVFCEGYKVRGHQVCYGTGLSRPTVIDCVDSLCKFGILKRVSTTGPDGAEYEINFDPMWIKTAELKERREARKDTNRKRTERAREKLNESRVVNETDGTQSPRLTESGQPDLHMETKETKETEGVEITNISTPPLKFSKSSVVSDERETQSAPEEHYVSHDEIDKEEKKPSARGRNYRLAAAISRVTEMQLDANLPYLLKEAGALGKAVPRPTPESIEEYYGQGRWWFLEDWRGKRGELPTPSAIRKTWGQWERSAKNTIIGRVY